MLALYLMKVSTDPDKANWLASIIFTAVKLYRNAVVTTGKMYGTMFYRLWTRATVEEARRYYSNI